VLRATAGLLDWATRFGYAMIPFLIVTGPVLPEATALEFSYLEITVIYLMYEDTLMLHEIS
jgi:hypothetical protein